MLLNCVPSEMFNLKRRVWQQLLFFVELSLGNSAGVNLFVINLWVKATAATTV
jgi:hypothetical protein